MKSSPTSKYIVIDDESQSTSLRQILHMATEPFTFPLSEEDKASMRTLERAFDEQGKIAGLAAPQIGIKRQAIIFQAPLELRKWRTDLVQTMPKTIWLNPRYEPLDA